MSILNNKKILLGITGSIAAYKSAELTRQLRQLGAQVKVVMTQSAQQFITPLTLTSLSNQPVASDLFAEPMEHITLARWADVVLVAPASANFMSKVAHGAADDLLTTLCLTTTAPIILAPAMNQQMWLNSLTQANADYLQKNNVQFWGPDYGIQACGEIGPGRMVEVEVIVHSLQQYFKHRGQLNNCRVLITAGPTKEPIDPVRYITNHSSGKMGYALANAASAMGAEVTLVTGPTHLPMPRTVKTLSVITAKEMHSAVLENINNSDIFISAAAISDFKMVQPLLQKMKKMTVGSFNLTLEQNPDILVEVAKLSKRPLIIGFAAETENLLANAQEKLKRKNLDFIVANLVGQGKGFSVDENAAMIISKQGKVVDIPLMNKNEMAYKLMNFFAEVYRNKTVEKKDFCLVECNSH